jgi:hypothetical protein
VNHPDREYYHALLLRKDKCGRLFCIDAQVGEDGLYPEQASGVKRIIKYLSNDGYTTCQYLTSARGAIIHSNEVAVCQTNRVPFTAKEETPKPSAASMYMSIKPKNTSKKYTLIDLAASPGQRIQINFMSAILKNDTKNIVRYIEEIESKHLKPEFQDSRGSSLMLAAVKMQMTDIVKYLCELGADPNLENNLGESPLDAAVKFPEITSVLRKCGSMKAGRKQTRRNRLRKSTRRHM